MSLKTYSPKDINGIFCGIPVKEGYVKGTFIEVKRLEPKNYELVIGAFGDGVRTKMENRAVEITITLNQSADANAALSALAILDSASNNGAGVAPTLIEDLGGTSLYACSESFIAQEPDVSFGTELGERKWLIIGILDTRFDGTN